MINLQSNNMEPIFIYFGEVKLYENNKFTSEFSRTYQIYTVHFSSKKDYYITSMNCDLNLEQDFKNDGVLDEISELSEKKQAIASKRSCISNMVTLRSTCR